MNGEPGDLGEYCRAVESYLCRRNEGHLVRVVGPAFDCVAAWAAKGVPLRVACRGIDRCVDRLAAKANRRRPGRIEFCDADVLDVFDEWRRAVGIASAASAEAPAAGPRARGTSLPAHLERVVLRLTAARAGGSLGAEFDTLIDRVSAELDAAREKAGGLRGDARQALLDRLSALDAELLQQARAAIDAAAFDAMARDADAELAGFRAGMPAGAFARAHDAAVNRLLREHFKLPTIAVA